MENAKYFRTIADRLQNCEDVNGEFAKLYENIAGLIESRSRQGLYELQVDNPIGDGIYYKIRIPSFNDYDTAQRFVDRIYDTLAAQLIYLGFNVIECYGYVFSMEPNELPHYNFDMYNFCLNINWKEPQ
jgi:hypothetical protein